MKTTMWIPMMAALLAPAAPGAVWYAGTGPNASDANDGTETHPVRSVARAVSLAKPGDTVRFGPGTYACSQVRVPDGARDLPITLRGGGKAIFSNDGSSHI